MAGRPGFKHLFELKTKEAEGLLKEITRLKTIILRIDPALLEDPRPAPLEEYDDKVPARVLSMADMGMAEEQWVSTFGITMKTWEQWKADTPELREAIEKAYVRALAWWDEKARQAQEEGNNRFPINVHERRTTQLRKALEKQQGATDIGDASRLVLLDLRAEGDAPAKTPVLSDAED